LNAPRLLVTGATGFIARHVIPVFASAGWHVRGINRRSANRSPWPDVDVEPCDLMGDPAAVAAAVARVRPDLVLHLAAMIPEDRQSAAWPWLELNGRATEQLLASCGQLRPMPRVVVMSSGAVYGGGNAEDPPFDEQSPISPATSYGVSKTLVEALATRASAALGLRVLRLRLFNVTGPGEPSHLAIGRFVRQVVDIERGRGDTLTATGDLSTARDYLDVRDAARAVFLAATAEDPGPVLNICSGRATPIADLLELLLQIAGLAGRVSIRARTGAPDPIRTQSGNTSRLAALTGWRPESDLARPLRDLLAERRTAGVDHLARSESLS
jgi:nucleoside-diphosphate-sugar epimerase